jgi:hypothetical protein
LKIKEKKAYEREMPKGMEGKQHKKGRNPKDQNIENGGSGTEHTWKMIGKTHMF